MICLYHAAVTMVTDAYRSRHAFAMKLCVFQITVTGNNKCLWVIVVQNFYLGGISYGVFVL